MSLMIVPPDTPGFFVARMSDALDAPREACDITSPAASFFNGDLFISRRVMNCSRLRVPAGTQGRLFADGKVPRVDVRVDGERSLTLTLPAESKLNDWARLRDSG